MTSGAVTAVPDRAVGVGARDVAALVDDGAPGRARLAPEGEREVAVVLPVPVHDSTLPGSARETAWAPRMDSRCRPGRARRPRASGRRRGAARRGMPCAACRRWPGRPPERKPRPRLRRSSHTASQRRSIVPATRTAVGQWMLRRHGAHHRVGPRTRLTHERRGCRWRSSTRCWRSRGTAPPPRRRWAPMAARAPRRGLAHRARRQRRGAHGAGTRAAAGLTASGHPDASRGARTSCRRRPPGRSRCTSRCCGRPQRVDGPGAGVIQQGDDGPVGARADRRHVRRRSTAPSPCTARPRHPPVPAPDECLPARRGLTRRRRRSRCSTGSTCASTRRPPGSPRGGRRGAASSAPGCGCATAASPTSRCSRTPSTR